MPVLERNKTQKSMRLGRAKLPVKRSINLVGVDEKPIQWSKAAPAIVVIVILAALLSKVAVVDRMNAVMTARREVQAVQDRLDAGYARIETLGDLNEKYAHYTYSGMTREELSRVDRVAVVKLIRRIAPSSVTVNEWEVADNQLKMTITARSLQQINNVAAELSADALVDYCSVSNASTTRRVVTDADEEDSGVSANILVYLKPEGGAAQ